MSNERNLVVKSNQLLNQPLYKSSIQLKIFSRLIIEIRANPYLEIYKLPINEIIKDFNYGVKNNNKLKILAKKMFKVIEIPKEKGFSLTALFINVDFDSVYLSFELNPKLKKEILYLRKEFTSYYLKNIAQLKSSFSIRIYELLKQYENIKIRVFTLSELRYQLGIEESKYKLYGHFKTKILSVAQKELSEKTDISFQFREIKEGRKVSSLEFSIKKKEYKEILKIPKEKEIINPSDSEKNISSKEEQEYIVAMQKLGIFKSKAKSIVSLYKTKKWNLEDIAKNLKYCSTQYKINGGIASAILEENFIHHQEVLKLEERKRGKEKVKRLEQLKLVAEKKRKLLKQLEKEFSAYEDERLFALLESNKDKGYKLFEKVLIEESNPFLKLKDEVKTTEESYIDFLKTSKNRFVVSIIKTGIIKRVNTSDEIDFIAFSKQKGYTVIKKQNEYIIT